MLSQADLKGCLHKRVLCRREVILLILSADVDSPKAVAEVKRMGVVCGFPEIQKWNVSDTLGKANGLATRLAEGWLLTSPGRKYVRALDVFPSGKNPRFIHAAEELREAASSISDKATTQFLGEALTCFEAGLHRACVVLSWVGAVALLYNVVVKKHLAAFNSEARRRDSKWRAAKTADDLTRMKESDFLDLIAAPPLSIIGRNVKQELKNNCLQLRNGCGHPNSLDIGANKAAAHLEILILNVYSRFSS